MVKTVKAEIVVAIKSFPSRIINLYALVLMIAFFGVNNAFGQKERSQYAGFQLRGPSTVSFNYEREFIEVGGFQLLGDFGFGIAEFPKGTEPNTVPITLAIHTGFPIQYRMGHFGIIGGVNPTTYIRGDLTFINLSGFFGLRFDLAKPTGGGGPFFTFAYTPRILNSLKQEGAVYPHTTLAFRIGASF